MNINLCLFKITTFVLLLIFSLTACVGDTDKDDVVESSSNETVSSVLSYSSEEASSEEVSSTEKETQSSSSSKDESGIVNSLGFNDIPRISESSKYGDLVSKIPGGKKVTVLGDLTDEKYNDAVSRLEAVLKGYSREISVVAYSLDNTKAVSFNAEAEIFPACTVKAAYSLYNCLMMDKGNGSLDTVMKYEKKHYEPGTGDMQYKPVGTEFDMRTIIHKSMSISDNVGYMMQVDYFGRDPYNKWVSDLGAPSLQIKPTVWALRAKADEHAVIWREIYRYFVSDSKHSKFLYSTCSGTDGNFASKALSGVSYSHKQGFNRDTKWNSMSDAGIVWKDGNPYVIVILTNSEGITSSAQNVMDQAIKIIHNEMF